MGLAIYFPLSWYDCWAPGFAVEALKVLINLFFLYITKPCDSEFFL